MKYYIVALAAIILVAAIVLPTTVGAATFYIQSNGKCYSIESKNLINQYYIIYRCSACDCKKKHKEATGFQTMDEAMTYLEKKYGELQPR